mmetsp:Transcript_49798/g.144802  ORF Transcript_49798/g.144802 Transcript_49798/m.144802 type:complete len:270 (+) Transcript_49798:389-1198(+)
MRPSAPNPAAAPARRAAPSSGRGTAGSGAWAPRGGPAATGPSGAMPPAPSRSRHWAGASSTVAPGPRCRMGPSCRAGPSACGSCNKKNGCGNGARRPWPAPSWSGSRRSARLRGGDRNLRRDAPPACPRARGGHGSARGRCKRRCGHGRGRRARRCSRRSWRALARRRPGGWTPLRSPRTRARASSSAGGGWQSWPGRPRSQSRCAARRAPASGPLWPRQGSREMRRHHRRSRAPMGKCLSPAAPARRRGACAPNWPPTRYLLPNSCRT